MKSTNSKLNLVPRNCSWHFQSSRSRDKLGGSWVGNVLSIAERNPPRSVTHRRAHTRPHKYSLSAVLAWGKAVMDGCLSGEVSHGCPSPVSLFNYTTVWMAGSKTAFSPIADFHLVCHVNSEINCSNCLQTSSNAYFFLSFYWIFIKLHVMSCLAGRSGPVSA